MGILAESKPFIDFISLPELGLGILAVLAVFVGLSGFMLVVATELAEEGSWFWAGAGGPVALLIISYFLRNTPIYLPLNILAILAIIGVPIFLAIRRPRDSKRTVVTGLSLFLGGGLVVAMALSIHYTHFVR